MAQNPSPVNIDFLLGAVVAIVSAFIGAATQYLLEGRRTRTEKKEQWVKTALEWAANGRKESLRRADLSNADLSYTDLRGADLTAATLENADLSYADLRDAYLTAATLENADLTGADLTGASLSGAHLSGAHLSGAKYDDTTQWPDGFDPVAAGAIITRLTARLVALV